MESFARQADAFNYGDKKNNPVFFKVFTPPEYKDTFMTCSSQRVLANNLIRAPHEYRTIQELLRDGNGTWLCPYWDIECYILKQDLQQTRERTIRAFNNMCETVFTYIDETYNPAFCRWSDSSGVMNKKFKFSLHCVYVDPGIAFQYNRANQEGRDRRRALNQFGRLCVEESKKYPELWEAGECLIDSAVWTTNRAMRCIGCHKPGSDRVLKPLCNISFKIDEDFTRTDVEAHLIARHLAPARPCRIKDSVTLILNQKKIHVKKDLPHLTEVAASIGCVIDSIKDNLITLKTCTMGRTCPITKERYMPGNNRCFLHIKNGEIYYRQHGVDGEKKIAECVERQYELFSDIDKLTTLYKNLGQEFTVDRIQQFLRDTVVYINKPFHPEFVVKVDGYEHGFGIAGVPSFKYKNGSDLFGKRCRSFMCRDVDGKNNIVFKKLKISAVLDDMVELSMIRSYNDVRYVPYNLEVPFIGKNVFNTFTPFSFLEYYLNKEEDPQYDFRKSAMHELLKTDLTGGDRNALEYLLNYIAHKLQHPAIRICTALAFCRTIQGIGKGQFADFLRMLFDDRNCKVVANLEHLFGNFNSHLRSSLWVFLEELKSKGGAWTQAGRLKDLISSQSQLWEKKHHETEEGGWYGSIVIFSNSSYGIRVENSDRRYVLFDTTFKYRDDKTFHDLVSAQTMNAKYMASAFRFFMDRDVSKWNWRVIPKTKTRTAVKQACESVFMSFSRWLFDCEAHFYSGTNFMNTTEKHYDNKTQIAYTDKDHLVYAFREYKTSTGHPTKVNETNAILDGIKLQWGPVLKHGQFRFNNLRRRCYKINVRALQTELTKQFRDPVKLYILITNEDHKTQA
jgi:hypothetical protein